MGNINQQAVVNSIIDCFLDVQKSFIEQAAGINAKESQKRDFVIKFLKKAFSETDGDFNKPTRESLMNAVNWLINSSPAPDNIKEAQEHRQKIFNLINSLG